MAVELATAYIALVPSLKGASQKISQELGSIDTASAGSNMGRKMGGSMASSIKSLVGPAIALMGAGMFGGFIKEAAAASDATDKFKATMAFAGMDTSAITAAKDAAKAYADQTVYDLPTIQNMTAQLASNGVKDYTGLTQAAGNLNAVAGGNAETFKSVAMVMTQTAGAGKLTTENWNQMADAIPGAAGPLMKAMQDAGAYTGNFRDAMAAGQITSDEFNAALQKLGNDPVAVEAAKSTKTFEGALGGLKSTINSGLMGALDKLKPAITGAISGLSAGLGKVFSAFGAIYDLFATGDFTGKIGKALGIDESSKIVGVILDIRGAVKDLFGAFKSGNGAAGLADFFTNIISSGAGLRDGLIKAVGAALPKIIGTIVAAAPEILNAAVQSFSSLITAVIETVPPLLTALLGMLPVIIPTLVGMIPTILAAGLQLFQGLVQAVIQALPQIISTLVAILPQVAGALVGMLPMIVQAGLDLFMGLVQSLVQLLPVLIDAVMKLLPSILSTLLGMLPQIIDSGLSLFLGVVTGLLQAAPTIINALLGMLPQLISTLIGMIPQLIQAAVQLFTGIVSALPIILPQLVDALIKIGPTLVSTLIGMIPMLFQAGAAIVQGIVDGIGSMMGAIGKAVLSLIPGPIVGVFKAALGIQSPSRVFRGFGKNIVEGLILGTGDKADDLSSTMRDLVTVPDVPAFGASMPGASGVSRGGSGTTNHWTINQVDDPIGTAHAVLRRQQALSV